jgi:uncharacterized damage-inducible protein DinB
VAETQREETPRNDEGELDTALAFLAFARHCAIKKVEGLDEEQLRRPMVGSGTNLLGLIHHLADSERWWFGHHVAGRHVDSEFDWSMEAPAGSSSEQVLADYRAAIAESDKIIGDLDDPEALTLRAVDGRPKTLRWVIAHMTSEVARHVGHADILREQIDDTTGR